MTETILLQKNAERELDCINTLGQARDLIAELIDAYGEDSRTYWTASELTVYYIRPETEAEQRGRLHDQAVSEHRHSVAVAGWEKLTEDERKALGLRFRPVTGEIPF